MFIANSAKYLYQSKAQPDTGNHSFSLKSSTYLSRLKNSEVYNTVRDRGHERGIGRKKKSKLLNFQQISQQNNIDSGI